MHWAGMILLNCTEDFQLQDRNVPRVVLTLMQREDIPRLMDVPMYGKLVFILEGEGCSFV